MRPRSQNSSEPTAVPRARRLWAPTPDFPAFQRQETLQILLNLAVMAGLMSLHAIYRPVVVNVIRPALA